MKPLVVPDMEEVHEGGMKRSVREIRIEDLLGREEISINLGEIGLLLKIRRSLLRERPVALVARSAASWRISRSRN